MPSGIDEQPAQQGHGRVPEGDRDRQHEQHDRASSTGSCRPGTPWDRASRGAGRGGRRPRTATDSMPLITARQIANITTLTGLCSYLPTSSVGNGRNATNARYTRLAVISDRSTRSNDGEELVMRHPVPAQQQERQEEADELRRHVAQLAPTASLGLVGVAVQIGRPDRRRSTGSSRSRTPRR